MSCVTATGHPCTHGSTDNADFLTQSPELVVTISSSNRSSDRIVGVRLDLPGYDGRVGFAHNKLLWLSNTDAFYPVPFRHVPNRPQHTQLVSYELDLIDAEGDVVGECESRPYDPRRSTLVHSCAPCTSVPDLDNAAQILLADRLSQHVVRGPRR